MEDDRLPAGLVIVRGLGYGAFLGLIGGYLVFPLSQLVLGESARDIAIGFLLGFLSAPIGLMYGCIAGPAVAVAFLPFRGTALTYRHARIVAAVVGPLAVAVISLLMFRPSFAIGANESRSHVTERMVLFFGVPGGCALIAGAVFGGRLARPIAFEPSPDSTLTNRSDWAPPAN